MNTLLVLVFAISFSLFGLFLIFGTILKFKILVDPPESWSTFYTNSYLKKKFGKEFLVIYNYVIGILMVLFSVFVIIQALMGNIHASNRLY